jgi:hypothetical protein
MAADAGADVSRPAIRRLLPACLIVTLPANALSMLSDMTGARWTAARGWNAIFFQRKTPEMVNIALVISSHRRLVTHKYPRSLRSDPACCWGDDRA